MSGTSMDAVDAALVDFAGAAPRLIAASRAPWTPELRERLERLAAGAAIDAGGFAALDSEAGRFIAEAIGALLDGHGIAAEQVTAIGCHGQTVAHAPDAAIASTLQLGDANVIAERTGITTVNDFRRRDIAAGGQGAPLTPAFHAAVLRDGREDRVVLNLGGIANITVLPADPDLPVTGFDTGPANCLMDGWVRRHRGEAYDAGGDWAASAEPHARLLTEMLDDPFFARRPPKSTGTQYFSMSWLDERLARADTPLPAEVQATLLALSCQSAADAIRRHAPRAARVLVCGGGVHNRRLMAGLATRLDIPVESTAAFGVDPDWMEAMAFAWLARQALSGAAGNLPPVTGARGLRILGAIHPA
jgi:anhydro-N-acetylmuramic acid kinase